MVSRCHSTRPGGAVVVSQRAVHRPLLAMPTITRSPMVARAMGWRFDRQGQLPRRRRAGRDRQQQPAEGRRRLAGEGRPVGEHGHRQALGDVGGDGAGLVELLAHDRLRLGEVGAEEEAVGVGGEDRPGAQRHVALEGRPDAEHGRAPRRGVCPSARGWGWYTQRPALPETRYRPSLSTSTDDTTYCSSPSTLVPSTNQCRPSWPYRSRSTAAVWASGSRTSGVGNGPWSQRTRVAGDLEVGPLDVRRRRLGQAGARDDGVDRGRPGHQVHAHDVAQRVGAHEADGDERRAVRASGPETAEAGALVDQAVVDDGHVQVVVRASG